MEANIVAHMLPETAPFGLKDESKMVGYFVMLKLAPTVHHFLAGVCAFAAWWWNSSLCFRITLSFEIGEDIMHYLQMAITAISPAHGIQPFTDAPVVMWGYLGLHHLIGVCAGTGAFLFTSDWPDVQFYVFLLLVAIVPGCLNAPLQMLEPPLPRPSLIGRVSAAIDVLNFLFLVYARFVMAMIVALRLYPRGFSEFGEAGGYFFAIILLGIAPLFFTLSFILALPVVIRNVRKQIPGRQTGGKEPLLAS